MLHVEISRRIKLCENDIHEFYYFRFTSAWRIQKKKTKKNFWKKFKSLELRHLLATNFRFQRKTTTSEKVLQGNVLFWFNIWNLISYSPD